MNPPRTIRFLALGSALVLVPVLCFGLSQDAKPGKSPEAKPDERAAQAKIMGATLMPASDVKWGPMEGLEGAKQAPLWGDPTKGEHGILYQWPAGTLVPQHTHTFGDRGVVISGTMTLAVDGAPAKKLPPGSYFSLAGGVKHVTGCEEGAPCVFFLQREGKFDVNMVEAAKK
jgi:quercetin dioxygenase-like cupin family protein